MHRAMGWSLAILLVIGRLVAAAGAPENTQPTQESPSGIKHSFLALGGETYIVDDEGKFTWKYPANTRDGFVLANGNILLAVSRGKEFLGGAAIEMTRTGEIVWQFKGTQSEVNTVQKVSDDRYMLTEAGNKPRILEVDKNGRIVVEVALQA